MVTVRAGLAGGGVALAALLTALSASVGLGPAGWGIGLGCGLTIGAALARSNAEMFGPADLITLFRAVLACALAALVAESFVHSAAVGTLVALAVVALVTDALDGWLARRTGTGSTFGARFDGEVDAFVILVLSAYVAATVHPWVLAIGLARYAFAAAGWVLPWLRAHLPPRNWRRVVTAVQGVVLTTAAAAVLPAWLTTVALLVAAALLGESFGRDVLWLWRNPSRKSGRAGRTDLTVPRA